ncbi:MAG: nitroreductase family protein [Chitinivibrionales bacterium]|nr:nitroreductase family protein [Chitinivibrionales bacterium]
MDRELSNKLSPILSRRSIRSYQDKEISNELIDALLHAGMAAPSACAKDPWRFIVIRDKAMLGTVCEKLPNGTMLARAALGVVVCGDLNAAHSNQLSYMLQDCSACIENILITAPLLGLGAVWLGIHPRQERIDHLRKVLSLPHAIIPVSAIAIGYPDEHKAPRSRYDEGYVHNEKW